MAQVEEGAELVVKILQEKRDIAEGGVIRNKGEDAVEFQRNFLLEKKFRNLGKGLMGKTTSLGRRTHDSPLVTGKSTATLTM